jgi:hypothetical protein
MVGPLVGADDKSGSDHHQCWRRRWQAAWGVLVAGPTGATTEVEDVDGGPLGVLAAGPAVATTEVGNVDGGPPGGAGDRSDSGHHRSWRYR